MRHDVYLLETKFRASWRTVANLLPLVASQRKAERGVKGFVVVSHAIYLLETKFQVALRTTTKTLPLVARQRKAERGVKGFVVVSHAIYLLLHFVSHTVFLRIKDS
ncbi:hypothetical protein SAMN02745116_01125 [Pilibacter termitis]|uniref:Uncharacterized protein n=1 Tax=Pilibacter termitis TaxID=263852 RepID=A0A1T4MK86_9ENTE|nr:hypothetical protein [Pilibacter termitis]SJZ67256.1 hypothetical protein SAMN02745116_01125 [Pilibacter termitis]